MFEFIKKLFKKQEIIIEKNELVLQVIKKPKKPKKVKEIIEDQPAPKKRGRPKKIN